jgi:hypothetical protein
VLSIHWRQRSSDPTRRRTPARSGTQQDRAVGGDQLLEVSKQPQAVDLGLWCAPQGIRTPNRQIRRLGMAGNLGSSWKVSAGLGRVRRQDRCR